jgi:hypothetical protein
MLDILETYYKLGATDKANTIVEEFAETTIEELNYYFSLPSRYMESLDYELRLSIHYLQRLNEFSKQDGDPELSTKIETALTNAFSLYQGQ